MRIESRLVLALFLLFLFAAKAYAFTLDGNDLPAKDVSRALNDQGMTGLVLTTSAYSLKQGQWAVATGGSFEDISSSPSYQEKSYPLSAAYGLSDSVELGLQTAQVDIDGVGTGMAGLRMHAKWRFKDQKIGSPFAAAVEAGLIVPSGNNAYNEVNNLGLRLHVMIASEINLDNGRYIGRYAEAVLAANDLGANSIKTDNYARVNAGILYPVSDDKKLQFILEGSAVLNRNRTYLGLNNYSAVLTGLRYATPDFNLTGALEGMSRQGGSGVDTKRFVVSMGIVL